MKETVLLVAGLFTVLCSHGEAVPVWQNDPAPGWEGYTFYCESPPHLNSFRCRQFPNDDAGIIVQGSAGDSSAVVVIEGVGDIIINDTFSADFGASFMDRCLTKCLKLLQDDRKTGLSGCTLSLRPGSPVTFIWICIITRRTDETMSQVQG
jgi:hypothetical protein